MPEDRTGTADRLFCTCLLLGRLYLDKEQLFEVLHERAKCALPPVPTGLLGSSIRDADAYRYSTKHLRPRYLVPHWPESLERGLASGVEFKSGLDKLKKFAPVQWP